ncbi:uncharacterized protein Z519_12712 [Cladophialophora bantiana CBS 173.52]|uniref:Major facilitator superfamily (MFS) profile domain-containing protein n=1 Tax=Cladophialophora bantiana (strain ATCC 10958 / CBS 173.52 / CDC B-1940 / NIH 8579) TaxID=1442370 RepID=A0A0D2FIY2_CLAB1|nr:uncharacterized protein Z519_12712 [Cladophialophora bantiana CBS 173.52]KIW86657.1 hypothetical protein Z519_12712 [Cladophialophora bantiana CBS 173.52]
MPNNLSAKPTYLRVRSSKAFIVSSCTLAIFTDCFLYGIVVPVLPFALSQRAGIAPENVGIWSSALLACYAGTWLLASPLAGYLTDYFTSRRTTFVIALLTLSVATILLYIGSSISVLLLGRILQGVSSALTWTAGFTLAVETVEETEVGKTMGICSLGTNLALLFAPVIGGLLLDKSGYHSVFAVAFGLLSLDMAWRLALIERSAAAPWLEYQNNKYWTIGFGNNGTPSIMPSPIREEIPHLEPLWLETEIQLIEKYGAFGEFIVRDTWWANFTRTISPTLRLLRNPRLQVALWATFAQATMITSLDAVLPLFVRDTFSWGAQGAGLIFIPVVLPTFLAPYIGRMTDKYGPKWMAASAFILGCPIWILMRLITHGGVGQIVLLCIFLAMLGTTTTLATPPLMAEITFTVESQTQVQPGAFGSRGAIAQAYAFYSLWLAGGLLAGPLWGGFVFRIGGWKTMTWTFGLLSGITMVPTIHFMGGKLNLAKII